MTVTEKIPKDRARNGAERRQGLQGGENDRDAGGSGERGGQREESRRDNPLADADREKPDAELAEVEQAPASAEIDVDHPPAQSQPVQPAIPEEVLLDEPPIRDGDPDPAATRTAAAHSD